MAGIGAKGDIARINTNVGAVNAYNHLRLKNREVQKHQEQLATGRKINRASDSPANYVIAKKLTSKYIALQQAQENLGDAMSALQEADSALAQIQGIMLDMKQLAQQAQTDTMGVNERAALEFEINQYALEINDIAGDTNWFDNVLLDGQIDWVVQVGEKMSDTLQLSLTSGTLTSEDGIVTTLGFNTDDLGLTDLSTGNAIEAAATWANLTSAETRVLEAEEKIGASINRLQLKSDALRSAEANTEASISRFQDIDIALAQMNLAKANILQQIALQMLTQSEQAPGAFLSLFQ